MNLQRPTTPPASAPGGNRKVAARRDMAVMAAVSVAAAIICVKFDLSETLLGWTRLHERLQLDELPAILLVVATCLIWFSSRRYFEAQRQLDLRRLTECQLADALAQNQRLAQQYLDMQEAERKALARDLHDELGQYLNVIKLDAVSMRDSDAGNPLLKTAARTLIENVDRVYGVVADMIRQLRPVGFDELGVAAALEHCVNDWRGRFPGTINLSIEADLHALDEIRALTLFRLVQEAMTNVVRHSRATNVEIHIVRRGESSVRGMVGMVDVSIADDGRGVDLDVPRAGLGLVGMRERVAAFGGSLNLVTRPGGGFKVMAAFPVSAAPAAPRAEPAPEPNS